MSVVRRVAMLCVASVILLAAASAPAYADARPVARCGNSCGADTAVTRTGTRSPVESCIHDPGCGGGGSLTMSANSHLAACAVASSIVISALAIRRHRTRRILEPTGSLIAGRLFRPPRFVLGR